MIVTDVYVVSVFSYMYKIRQASLIKCLVFFLVFFSAIPAIASSSDKTVADMQHSPIPYSVYHQRLWDTRDNMPQVSAVSIAQDKTGFIWVATEGGLARFDGHHFRAYDAKDSPVLLDPILRSVFVDSLDQLWIGTSSGLIVKRGSTFTKLDVKDVSLGKIEGITEFAGKIYVGGNDIFIVDKTALTIDKIGMGLGPVTALVKDQESLWAVFNNALVKFKHDGTYQTISLKGQPSNFQINHLVVYQDRVLVGTSRGVYQVDDDGQLTLVDFDGKPVTDAVGMLYADSKGNLWIACEQILLQIYGDKIVEEVSGIDRKTLPWFVAAFEDKLGNLWLGSRTHGLLRLRFDGSRNYGLNEGLAQPFVWTFAQYQDGILVGSNAGLYRFKEGHFTPLVDDERLPNPVVYTLFVDSQQRIWAGTRAGVAMLDSDFKVIRQFPRLQNYQVNGVTETPDGKIWIATLEGLYSWNGESLVNESKRLSLKSVNTRAVFADQTGRLWIGTAVGAYQYAKGKLTTFSEDKTLSSSLIAFFTQLHDGTMVVGTFQSGVGIQTETGWYWPDAGRLPAKNALFAAEYDESLVISSSKGVYKVALASLKPKHALDIQVLVDDYGAEANTDGIRCCNGAGNAKGLLYNGMMYLPTLNGVAEIDLSQAIDSVSLPQPVIEGMEAENRWYDSNDVVLPRGQRNVGFKYSSPKFYRNSALRFRYMLEGYNAGWSGALTRREAFYTNLPPGAYQFKVQTRMDEQGAWSAPAIYRFTVPAYWYEQNWMIGIFVCLGILALWGVVQLRMRRLEHVKARLEEMVAARTMELDKANKQLEEANKQLEEASLTDALTGFKNRRYLDVYIDQILARCQRLDKGVFCILLDIDNFKILNDQLGHSVGDDILVAFCDVLRRQVRNSDHLVRWGGEEFLILLDVGVSVAEFMERLMDAIATHVWPHDCELPNKPSCSAGVCYHHSGLSNWQWEHSLILADKAMYLVKRGGKAGWLHMQPKVDMPTTLSLDVPKLTPEELLRSHHFDLRGSAHIMSSVNKIKQSRVENG